MARGEEKKERNEKVNKSLKITKAGRNHFKGDFAFLIYDSSLSQRPKGQYQRRIQKFMITIQKFQFNTYIV